MYCFLLNDAVETAETASLLSQMEHPEVLERIIDVWNKFLLYAVKWIDICVNIFYLKYSIRVLVLAITLPIAIIVFILAGAVRRRRRKRKKYSNQLK